MLYLIVQWQRERKGMTCWGNLSPSLKKHPYSSLEESKNKDYMNNINADCGCYLKWVNEPIREWRLEKVWMMISELDRSSTLSKVVFYLRIQGAFFSLIVVQIEGDWIRTALNMSNVYRYNALQVPDQIHNIMKDCSDSRALLWMLNELWI